MKVRSEWGRNYSYDLHIGIFEIVFHLGKLTIANFQVIFLQGDSALTDSRKPFSQRNQQVNDRHDNPSSKKFPASLEP